MEDCISTEPGKSPEKVITATEDAKKRFILIIDDFREGISMGNSHFNQLSNKIEKVFRNTDESPVDINKESPEKRNDPNDFMSFIFAKLKEMESLHLKQKDLNDKIAAEVKRLEEFI